MWQFKFGYLKAALRLSGALWLVLSPMAAHAEWNAANDEANRQRMMRDMRQSAAAADKRSFDAQQSLNRSNSSGGSSSGRSSSSSSSSSGSAGASGPAQPVDTGPQSVVATYYFKVQIKETEAQTIARVTKEADGGNAQSQFDAARIYYTGYATPVDIVRARTYFGMAAKQRHVLASSQYGIMVYNGQGGPQDQAVGMKYISYASDHGDPYGQALKGFFILQAHASEPEFDFKEAIGLLITSADEGQMLAQATLGRVVYYFGVGAQVDAAKAVHYIRLAADQGDPGSMDDLGEMYMVGANGVPKDPQTGIKWLKKSADAGYARAQFLYANIVIAGALVPEDLNAGFKYAGQSAKGGDANGQVLYAKCFYFGYGTPKDITQSLYWFRKAAALGNQEAIDTLKEPEFVEAAKRT